MSEKKTNKITSKTVSGEGTYRLKRKTVHVVIQALTDMKSKGKKVVFVPNRKQWMIYYSYSTKIKGNYPSIIQGDDVKIITTTSGRYKIFRKLETAVKYSESYFTKRFGPEIKQQKKNKKKKKA